MKTVQLGSSSEDDDVYLNAVAVLKGMYTNCNDLNSFWTWFKISLVSLILKW